MSPLQPTPLPTPPIEPEPDPPGLVYRRYVKVDANGVVTADNETGTWPWEWEKFDAQPLPADLIDVTDHPQWAGIASLSGKVYQPDGTFTDPPETVRDITAAQFFDLFTPGQFAKLMALIQSGDVTAIYLWESVKIRPVINILSPRVSEGLAYLVSKKVLTEAEKAWMLGLSKEAVMITGSSAISIDSPAIGE